MDSAAYRTYMDGYAAFVKSNSEGIDYYANVDVISNPEASYQHQKYLEEQHGLCPVPVVHCGTPLKWVELYINAGYNYLGIGGIASAKGQAGSWLERCFDLICSTPKRLPAVRTHGFGVGGLQMIVRYPWFSIDTARWAHLGSRGYFVVPKRRSGVFLLQEEPTVVKVGNSPRHWKDHCKSLPALQREAVKAWLDEIGLKEADMNQPAGWYSAYLHYYKRVGQSLSYPRSFRSVCRGLLNEPVARGFLPAAEAATPLEIYYSGNGITGARPEDVLGSEARVMLTYYEMPCKRFTRILRARCRHTPI